MRSIRSFTILAAVAAALALAGCDDGSEDDDGGDGGGDGGGSVSTCADLCDLASVTTDDQLDCLGSVLAQLGEPITSTVECQDGFQTTAQCLACRDAATVSDANCAQAHGFCYH